MVFLANTTSLYFNQNITTYGVSYTFKVQARNAAGLSDFNGTSSIIAATNPDAVTVTTNYTATNTSQITFTWEPLV